MPPHDHSGSAVHKATRQEDGDGRLFVPQGLQARLKVRPPKIWIVGGAANETNLALAAEWRTHNLAAWMIAPDDAGARVAAGDVAIGRLDVRHSLDGVEPGLLALHELARRGVRVVNRPAAILRAHDKLRTARALFAHGVPHPRTAHLVPGGPVPLPLPFVVKPRFGSWGADVFRCMTQKDVLRTQALLASRAWFRRQGAVVQEFIPNSGHDLRMLVAGGRLVGADERLAREGEWRTNVSLGAAELPADPSSTAEAVAVAAVSAVGGDLFGVDLMPVDGGYIVLEVNGAVEFDGLYTLYGHDVYAEVATALGLIPPATVKVRSDQLDRVSEAPALERT